ncbi:hypothetical protein SAMN02745181_0478 [Rubritalea squalenifaciens DSM 18772]|uniref:Uncharacterized protein n=1 Tax=Rubritalea squalenifaciens DSM 18772 TaxID=1123071 RepID=A0A1M6CHX0_9BACT|nr:hypothetical protein [Rubritalea squalenifaciens]SHI60298.1 hypothetical protein SAMN02745181_0478 [Rubritalea squalenifaciens DSM 18772]
MKGFGKALAVFGAVSFVSNANANGLDQAFYDEIMSRTNADVVEGGVNWLLEQGNIEKNISKKNDIYNRGVDTVFQEQEREKRLRTQKDYGYMFTDD